MLEPWEGTLRWSLETLAGEVITSGQEPVQAALQTATQICKLDFSDSVSDDNVRELVFIAELWRDGQIQSRQTAFFVPTKHLALAEPGISAQLRVEGERICIELTSHSLARLVECALEGAEVVFSDNYFDLPAGRTVSISAPLPAGWISSQAQAAFKVRSVYDSYAHGAAN
jgi:beta-mannosidase